MYYQVLYKKRVMCECNYLIDAFMVAILHLDIKENIEISSEDETIIVRTDGICYTSTDISGFIEQVYERAQEVIINGAKRIGD